ncbi:MAG TPA: hypothetical protein VLR26_17465 [Frankiaceae bacterium]|nr:hypothetical protein [Frankiaceae bacterium]
MNRDTTSPWALSRTVPGLPARCASRIYGSASPRTVRGSGTPVVLSTPWSSAAVRLPVRATALPGMATTLPVPRQAVDGSVSDTQVLGR